MSENIYNFFDDIVCINLKHCTERKKNVENIYDKYNIPGRFFITEKHPSGGIYGCFDSHINIIKEAYENNLDYILVFEDDIKVTNQYSEELLSTAIDFMKNNDTWDIFYLGYSLLSPYDQYNVGQKTIFSAEKISNHIIKYNPNFTHALCYSKKCMKTILDEYKYYIGIVHYDDFLAAKMKLNSYCIIPILFDQNRYFEYNVEAREGFEYAFRFCYPFLEITNIENNIILFYYNFTTNSQAYVWFYKYIFIMFISLIMNIIKRNISKNKYINIY